MSLILHLISHSPSRESHLRVLRGPVGEDRKGPE